MFSVFLVCVLVLVCSPLWTLEVLFLFCNGVLNCADLMNYSLCLCWLSKRDNSWTLIFCPCIKELQLFFFNINRFCFVQHKLISINTMHIKFWPLMPWMVCLWLLLQAKPLDGTRCARGLGCWGAWDQWGFWFVQKCEKIWLLAGELPGFLRGIAVVPMRKRLNLHNAQSTCRGQLTFPDPCPSISARVVWKCGKKL